MILNKTFVVYGEINAAGREYEEHEIEIPASDKVMATNAGELLCKILGLKFKAVFEKDWK